jgi:hypothetical protein
VSNIIGLMKVRSFITVAFTLLFFRVPALRAADVQWPAKLGTWTATADADLPEKAISSDPAMRESGLISASSKAYRDGNREVALTLYTFRDSSGAYEGYSMLQGRTHDAVIVRSNQVVSASGGARPEELVEVGKWAQSISDHVSSPPIATYMPPHTGWRVPDRYALGPVGFRAAAQDFAGSDVAGLADAVGFSSDAEAMFGRYESGNNAAALLLVEYPTPQLAELHLRHLQRALHDAKLNSSSVERKGSLLSIVLAPTSAEYAEMLRGAVNYETEVTWNEPGTTATDPPITSTLVKIIIATMVLMGMAFVLGIAFGGVRVITKRLFPGKVFDRPAQMEVLQLGLSGKPIDPRDMY